MQRALNIQHRYWKTFSLEIDSRLPSFSKTISESLVKFSSSDTARISAEEGNQELMVNACRNTAVLETEVVKKRYHRNIESAANRP